MPSSKLTAEIQDLIERCLRPYLAWVKVQQYLLGGMEVGVCYRSAEINLHAVRVLFANQQLGSGSWKYVVFSVALVGNVAKFER